MNNSLPTNQNRAVIGPIGSLCSTTTRRLLERRGYSDFSEQLWGVVQNSKFSVVATCKHS